MTEPCPFCGRRVEPIREGVFKRCPVCGGKWYESGGGGRDKRPSTPGTGAAAKGVIVVG